MTQTPHSLTNQPGSPKVIISSEIEPLLNSIGRDEDREKVTQFFMDGVYLYYTDMQKLIADLEDGRVNLKNAELQLTKLTNEVLKRGAALVSKLEDKKIIMAIKTHFRKIASSWAYKGLIVKRALDKPQGYPGDYLVLDAIYDSQSPSHGIGFCSDRYFFNDNYCIAVRNRLEQIKGILKDFIASNPPDTEARILNIACGSVRELRDLLSENHLSLTRQKVHITCFDQDREALDFSKRKLEELIQNPPVEFVQGNVLKFLGREISSPRYHLIYTLGLADYLPDRVLKKLLAAWVGLLEPKGTLVITHKDIEKSDPAAPDWFCDWNFYSRNETQVRDLLSPLLSADIHLTVEREPTNQIMFFTLHKEL